MFYRNRTNFEIIFYTLQGILTKNKQTYVCNRPGFCLLVLPQVLYWRGLSCLGLTFGVFPGLLGQYISVTYRRRTARKKLALTTWPETHRPRAIMTPQRGSGLGILPSFGLNGHVPPNRVWFGGVLNNTGG